MRLVAREDFPLRVLGITDKWVGEKILARDKSEKQLYKRTKRQIKFFSLEQK